MVIIKIGADMDRMPDGTPLKNVDDYSSADVLCGRGGGTNHHTGNNHWRALVAANKRLYISLPKKQKVLVARSIVHAVRSQTPGGRFLSKDVESNTWNDIGDQKATEKTSQALREGAPDIRTQMEQKQKNPGPANRGEGVAGRPKPGQVLPNGLITLDYEGVASAQKKVHRGPHQDGTLDVNTSVTASNVSIPPKSQGANVDPIMMRAQAPQGRVENVDPIMMRAFQQFQAGLLGQGRQQNGAPAGMPPLGPGMARQQQLKLQCPTPSQQQKGPQSGRMAAPGPGLMAPGRAKPQKPPFRAPSAPGAPPTAASRGGVMLSAPGRQGPPSEGGPTKPGKKRFMEPSDRDVSQRPKARPQGNPTGPPTRKSAGARPLPPAPLAKAAAPAMQSQPVEQLSMGATPPSSFLGVASSLFGRGGNHPSDQAPTSHRDSGTRPPNAISREMALQILLRERAQQVQQARDKAADAQLKTFQNLQSMAAGGRGPPAGFHGINNGVPPRPSSLLADYLDQQRANPALLAPPAPLPTLGDISSMSDEAIREMLHMLKQQPQHIALDAYRLAGVTNNNLGSAKRTRPPSELDDHASQYANLMSGHPQPPPLAPALAQITSLGQPPEALRSESLGLQQVFQDAMRYLEPHEPSALESSESLGPTPLRPGVSATLAQMKMADLYKQGVYNTGDAGTGETLNGAMASSVGNGSIKVFNVPPNVAISATNRTGAAPLPTFKTGAALNDHVKMTSAPRQGVSCASLDDLCRAAGLHLSPDGKSLLPKSTSVGSVGSGRGSEQGRVANSSARQPATSAGDSGLSNKMKMIQGLMDAAGQQRKGRMQNPASAPRNGWASTEWENVKKASNNAKLGLKLGKNDQSLVDDSDEEGDRNVAKRQAVPTQLKRRMRQSSHEKKRPAKRQNTASSSTGNTGKETARGKQVTVKRNSSQSMPRAAVVPNGGVSFSQDMPISRGESRSLPITETTLSQGHSLAMSEISLDRGQSMSAGIGLEGVGDDGQFSDASEDRGLNSPTGRDRLKRGLTIGTNHTFASFRSA